MGINKKRKAPQKLNIFANWRIKALFVIFLLVSSALIGRLYHLQVVNGDYYSALAVGQGINIETQIENRGNIYFKDASGQSTYLAATNRKAYIAYADPSEIKDIEIALSDIKNVLELTPEEDTEILKRFKNKDSSFALIKRNLTKEQAAEIDKIPTPGLYARAESVRYYPQKDLAEHVVGFLGFSRDERAGQYGVEEYYNGILSGEEDPAFSITDIFSDSKEGADLALTLDYNIQFTVERKLEELTENLNAEGATAIFMDPETGAIIAMANTPGFNLNKYNETEDISVFGNDAMSSVYEPGSVFKPITMAAAIDAGAVTPQTIYEDTGSADISGYTIRNSDGEAHGLQTMTEVLEKSLNTGVIFAQEKLGKKKFRKYMKDFELDEPTAVDLPGEASGDINNIKNTDIDVNFATAAFGQGISFSPLRLLASISAIANDGVIMRPYIVDKIIKDGREIKNEPKTEASPISSITAARVTEMMVSVVENGFGEKAKVPGYTVAGKTGTAQVPNPDGPGYSDKTIHSFVGFAPAHNPAFVGIIKVDNPQGIRFSADSVTPAFGEIANFILQYYKIPPQ